MDRSVKQPRESDHLTAKGRPKRGYNSERSAEVAARALRKKLKQQINYYKCDECPHWHIGHRRQPIKQ